MSDLTSLAAGTYLIDPAHSEVGFVARHAMVTKVRGSFREFDGSITVADELAQSTASATIKTASIETGNADRDGHLISADFFDAEANPQITFAATGLSNVEGATFDLTGDLTISGITKAVTLTVEFEGTAQDPFGNIRAGFSATTTIEREDWNLTYNAALETGGVLISKKIALTLEISAIKQA